MEPAQKHKVGWYATLLGVAMVVTSIILASFLGVTGSAFHNTLQIGGLVLVIGGYLGLGGRQYHRRKKEP